MAAAVITYLTPTAVGSVTPPTQQQMSNRNLVVAKAVFADGATIASIVHNMQIPGTPGAPGLPKISVINLANGTALNVPVFAYVDANTISIAQVLASANTGATYQVSIERPAAATQ